MVNSLKKISIVLSLSIITTLCVAKDKLKDIKEPSGATFKVDFQKAFGGEDRDKAFDVISLDDGGFMVAGESESYSVGRDDMLVVRFDKEGKMVYRSSFGQKKRERANAVSTIGKDNFIAVGYTTSYSKYGDKDLFVVKFDKDGKSIFKKHFGGDRDDEALDVVGLKNGNALIVGYTESYGKGYKDLYLLYIDKDGKEIWSKAIGGKDDDIGYSIALTKGGFYIAGSTRSFGSGGFDFYLLKFNSKAKLLFSKIYGEYNDDILKSVYSTSDGGCVVAGETKSFGSKRNDLDVMRFNSEGGLVWHKIFGFKSKDWANDIVVRDDNSIVVAGSTKSFGYGNSDFYILELNKKGSVVWSKNFGGSDKDEAKSLTVLKDGSVVVVGDTLSFGKGDYDFMMIKLSKR
jgi:uncharacterized delta-60 repeat protein